MQWRHKMTDLRYMRISAIVNCHDNEGKDLLKVPSSMLNKILKTSWSHSSSEELCK